MKKLATSGYFLAAFAALCFSFKSILVKFAYAYGVDAMTLMLMRTFISLPLFLATLFLLEGKEALRVTAGELMLFAFMGVVGVGCAMLFSFYSLELIDASLSTMVVFTYPAMTVMGLMIFLRERLTVQKVLSLTATFLGLALVLRIDLMDFIAINKVGIIFALISALAFAIYNALSERAMKGVTPIKLVSYSVMFLAGFFGLLFGDGPYPANPEIWGIAAILGVFTGFIPFLCFIYGIKRIGAGKAVIISSLGPALTVFWAYILLGERLDIVQIAGMVVIVGGVMALKLRGSVRFVAGAGEEIKQGLEDIVRGSGSGKKAFAFIYVPGRGKERDN